MKELLLFPAQDTNAPKLAVDGDKWAVVTWGREGVRLAVGHMDDLKEPEMPEPTEPQPPDIRVTKIDVATDGGVLRATATVIGPWDWVIWRITRAEANAETLVKVDDLSTTVEGLEPGAYHVTAEAVKDLDAKTVLATIAEPVKPIEPKPEILPWIDIRMTIPTPGSGPNAAMLDRGRLKAIADIDPDLIGRYNLDFRRRLDAVHQQVELYARSTPVEKHIPIIDWSETGTTPDPGVDPQAVADFAVMVVKTFGFRFVELGNEVWQKDTPTSEYFRVAVPVAQALLAQTDCRVGICCDYADYGSGKRRRMVDLTGLQEFLDDDYERLVACIHPYPNPASNSITLATIADVAFASSTVYATEWGVKNTDVAGLKAGLDALRRANIPLVSLYVYDDGPPDYMGLLKTGNVRTPTGDFLTLYIHQMRKDHGRETPPDPVVPPDPPTGVVVLPSKAEYRKIRGNFLALQAKRFQWAFLYPGWDEAKRRSFREYYRALNYRHLPIGVWGNYHGEPETIYDFSQDVAGFRAILTELWRDGIWPIVFLFTDAVGKSPGTLGMAKAWATSYVPQIKDLLVGTCSGWEFTGDQDDVQHLDWLKHLRKLLGPDILIYEHYSPERWAQAPDRIQFDEDVTQDEIEWLRLSPADGLFYQEPPNKPLDAVFERAFRIQSPHGWPPGIKGRVEAGAGKDFVFFEHSRDSDRHALVVAECIKRGVTGWC